MYDSHGTQYRVKDLVGTRSSAEDTVLAQLFFNSPTRTLSNPGAPARLRIDATSAGSLGVTAIFEDGREVAVTLLADKAEFACDEGKFELSSGNFDVLPIALAFVGGKTTHTLSRASDGSLIVESRMWAAGTALLRIPVGFSDRMWSRFAPAGDEVAGSK